MLAHDCLTYQVRRQSLIEPTQYDMPAVVHRALVPLSLEGILDETPWLENFYDYTRCLIPQLRKVKPRTPARLLLTRPPRSR